MATELRLAGWKALNLRCPDHEVIFERREGDLWPISLIQMPNGTGKTTTLQLLRASLSGDGPAGGWTPDTVRQFRKKGSKKTQGVFETTVLCNERRYTFRLIFDFVENTVHYTTTLKSGLKNGFYPPQELQRFLRPGFVNLFIFDGEQAALLLDSQHTNAEAAIEDLFQLKTLNHMVTRIQDHWDAKVEGQGAKEEKGYNRRKNRVTELKKQLAEARSLQSEQRQQHDAALRKLQSRSAKFEADIQAQEAVRTKLQEAGQKVTAAAAQVETMAANVLRQTMNPAALSARLAKDMLDLKGGFDRVQLPEKAAREFFEELADEVECICGRAFDDASRQAIRERASRYLGSDEVSLLNSIKGDISRLVGAHVAEQEAALCATVKELEEAIESRDSLVTELDAIRDTIVGDRPELEAARKEIKALEEQVKDLATQLKRFEDPENEDVGLKFLERELKEAEVKLAEITNTLQLKQKRDILKKILGAALRSARAQLGTAVCRDANDRIGTLLPNNDIRVEKIDSSLVLSGQEGGSVGETLSVAYAFLSTLFTRAEHSLPFIVDSPAGPIDLAVRSSVAELVPGLSRQFVAFTISSEREGFLDPLERAAPKGGIQYLTAFRKSGDEAEKAAKKRRHVETDDGLVVEDREYFRTFHVDRQEV
jgi:DNA sulfur modification protein DndD